MTETTLRHGAPAEGAPPVTPVTPASPPSSDAGTSPDVFAKALAYTRPEETRALGLYPYFQAIEDSEATEVVIEGRRRIMVGSNNYLGLTHDPRVLAAAADALARYGAGCTGSRFLNGNTVLHDRLEAELAEFTGKAAALVFPTGYQANVGVVSALLGRGDVAFVDRLDHASIMDGCAMALGETVRFRHGALDELDEKLARHVGRGKLIVVDGVYSMEGDVVDLPGLVALRDRHGARLMVDDAHALGVLGASGAGTAEHFGLTDRVDLVVGTFSKSLASIGGFAAGDAAVISYLRHHARSLIFSAALPPASCAAVLASLDILRREPDRRVALWRNARRLREGLVALGFDVGPTQTPIIPVMIGDLHRTLQVWRALFDAGVFTNPVVPPAVPERACRLRTSVMATHSDAQLDRVLEVFADVGERTGLLARPRPASGAECPG